MRVYYLLLYKLWRLMQWSRRKVRFWRRESLFEATASTMVAIWSNWVFVGLLLLLKIPYFGRAPKSGAAPLVLVSSGLLGFWLIYWVHLCLVKSSYYQTSAATFATYSRSQSWLASLGAGALLLSLYLSPWLIAKQLL